MMDLINALAALSMAIVTGWAVLSPRVRDGIVIKSGLICLSVGFLSAFLIYEQHPRQHDRAIDAVHLLIYIGFLICVFGYWLRTRKGLNRRLQDWVDLNKRSMK